MATKKAKQEGTPLPVAPKTKYDPNKRWGWAPDAKISFTGMEFHKINMALSEFITSDMSVPVILKLAEAFSVMQNKLAEYVDNGTVQEMPDQK